MSFCFDKFNDWRLFFLLFVAISVVTLLWLGATHIEEEKNDSKNATFTECFALLANPYVLLCFIGIMCHVGIDVGVNASAPTIFYGTFRAYHYPSLFCHQLVFLIPYHRMSVRSLHSYQSIS